MKSKFNVVALFFFGFVLNPAAYADDVFTGGTMDVVDEQETEYEYMEHVAPNDNALFGTDVSNMARNPEAEYEGREFGEWVSGQVRQDALQHAAHEARADLKADNALGHRPE